MVIQDEEQLIVAAEVRSAEYSESQLDDIMTRVRSAIATYSGLSPFEVLLLAPRTIAKTTSGKISRSRVKEAYRENTLQVLSRRIFGAFVNKTDVDATDPENPDDLEDIADPSGTTETENGNGRLADEAMLPSQVDHVDTVDVTGCFDVVRTSRRGAGECVARGRVFSERNPVLFRVERRFAGDDVAGLAEASAAEERFGAVLRSGRSCGAAL